MKKYIGTKMIAAKPMNRGITIHTVAGIFQRMKIRRMRGIW